MWLIGLAVAGSAYEQLRARDGASCTGLEVSDLLTLAESDVQPGYVPIRAADCLVAGHAADARVVAHARQWMTDDQRLGLAIVVANGIDRFTVADAVHIAGLAQNERLARRLRTSVRADVRAVVIAPAK